MSRFPKLYLERECGGIVDIFHIYRLIWIDVQGNTMIISSWENQWCHFSVWNTVFNANHASSPEHFLHFLCRCRLYVFKTWPLTHKMNHFIFAQWKHSGTLIHHNKKHQDFQHMALWFNSKATAAVWVLECKWKCCDHVVCWGFKSSQNHRWRLKYDRTIWSIRWINYFLYRRSGLLHAIDLMLTKCWGSKMLREVGGEKNSFCYSLIVITPVEIYIEICRISELRSNMGPLCSWPR